MEQTQGIAPHLPALLAPLPRIEFELSGRSLVVKLSLHKLLFHPQLVKNFTPLRLFTLVSNSLITHNKRKT